MSLSDFEFYRWTQVVFGKGKVKERLGSLLKDHGATKVLMTYGRSSIKKIGIYDECVNVMKEAGIEFWEVGGIRPNPEVSKTREGIKLVREHKIDFILAIGGGSVIDCSKAISFGHGYEGDVWEIVDNYWKKPGPDKKDIKITKFLGIGAIPTLAGTGSDFNDGAVISNDEVGRKLNMMGMLPCCPKFAILDPEYTFSVPLYQVRAGTFDIFSHCLDTYLTQDSPFLADRICEAIMKTVLHYMPVVIADPKSYEARSNLLWAQSVALCGLVQNGRASGGDWVPHMMEHEAAAVYNKLTHGMGLAIITIGWLRFCADKKPEKIVTLGKNVFDLKDVNDPHKVIDHMEEWLVKNGIPVYFHDDESTKTWSHEDSVKAAKLRTDHYGEGIGNYVKIMEADMVKIFDSRIKKE